MHAQAQLQALSDSAVHQLPHLLHPPLHPWHLPCLCRRLLPHLHRLRHCCSLVSHWVSTACPLPSRTFGRTLSCSLLTCFPICSGMLPAGSTTPAGSSTPAALPPAFGVSAASQPADALAAGEPWPPLQVLYSGASITTHANHSPGMWPSMINYVAVDRVDRIMCSGADAIPQRSHAQL